MPSTNFTTRLRLMVGLAALFLTILGAKLWLIQAYGSPLPFWDQWDEAQQLFIPWLDGHLTWHNLLAAHNEHRILFTRLLDLAEVWLNGQWDPRLQMVVNACIHAGFACLVAVVVWHVTGRKREGVICFVLMPFFAAPFGAENTLRGFQSQEYFLIILSLIAIGGLGLATTRQGWWWLGLMAAVMALFTMASGLLAPLAVAGLMGLRQLRQRRMEANTFVTLICSVAIFLAGLLWSVTVERHKLFQAQSVLAFYDALMRNLAWPFRDHPAMFYVIALPLVVAGVQYFRSSEADEKGTEFALGLGLWGLLQSAALAFGRAGLGDSSRYADTLIAIPIASLTSLFIIAERAAFGRIPRRLVEWLGVAWAGICFWGLWQVCQVTIGEYKTPINYLEWSKTFNEIEERNVRAFVATGDSHYLLNQPPWHIPYWDGEALVTLLRNPKLATILPPVCRPPLPLAAATNSDNVFLLNGIPPDKPKPEFTQVWGNYMTGDKNRLGRFVSNPLTVTHPEVSIQLCSNTNAYGIHVALVASNGTNEVAFKANGNWETVIASAPAGRFHLEMSDFSRGSWVAVGEIHELGRASAGARWLLNYALVVLSAGLFFFVVLAGGGGNRTERV